MVNQKKVTNFGKGGSKMRVMESREMKMKMKVKSGFQEQAHYVVYACVLHAVQPNFYMNGGGGVVR